MLSPPATSRRKSNFESRPPNQAQPNNAPSRTRPSSLCLSPYSTEAINRDELSARIADSFQEFSAMLTKLKPAAPSPAQAVDPPPNTTATVRQSSSSWSSFTSAASTVSSQSTTPTTTVHPHQLQPAPPPPQQVTPLHQRHQHKNTENDTSDSDDDDDDVFSLRGFLLAAKKDNTKRNRHKRRITKAVARAASKGDTFTLAEIFGYCQAWLDINASDDPSSGTTPLMYAACFDQPDAALLLIEAGADIDAQDTHGWTALMWAASSSHPNTVQVLIDHGASCAITSTQGRTVHDLTIDPDILDRLPARPSPRSRRRRRKQRRSRASLHGYEAMTHEEEASEPSDDEQWLALDAVERAQCEQSLRSIYKFEWNKCLFDQMLVFSPDTMHTIVDTLAPTPDYPFLPANAIFLCSRFAHYHSSRDLLHAFLDLALAKLGKQIQTNHKLGWLANVWQLLDYFGRDLGLRGATVDAQAKLADLLAESYVLCVIDCEKRLDKYIDGLLDYEQDEQPSSASSRRRSFFRSSTSSATSLLSSPSSSSTPLHSSPPQHLTTQLSALSDNAEQAGLPTHLTTQILQQSVYFIASELFNRILGSKKYLSRRKAIQIRMNVSNLEDWLHKHQLELHEGLQRVTQLLQFLQCVSQLRDRSLFQETVRHLHLLRPEHVRRCLLLYRYEPDETPLPDGLLPPSPTTPSHPRSSFSLFRSSMESDDAGWKTIDARHITPPDIASTPHPLIHDPPLLPGYADALCEQLKRRQLATVHRGTIPSVPEDWVARLDKRK